LHFKGVPRQLKNNLTITIMSNFSKEEMNYYFGNQNFESLMVGLSTELTDHFAPYYEVEPGKLLPLNPKEIVTIVPKHPEPFKLHFEFWFGKELICVVKYEGEQPSINVDWVSETPIEDVLDDFESVIAEMDEE